MKVTFNALDKTKTLETYGLSPTNRLWMDLYLLLDLQVSCIKVQLLGDYETKKKKLAQS